MGPPAHEDVGVVEDLGAALTGGEDAAGGDVVGVEEGAGEGGVVDDEDLARGIGAGGVGAVGAVVEEGDGGGGGVLGMDAGVVLKSEGVVESYESELVLFAVQSPDDRSVCSADLEECGAVAAGDEIVAINVFFD